MCKLWILGQNRCPLWPTQCFNRFKHQISKVAHVKNKLNSSWQPEVDVLPSQNKCGIWAVLPSVLESVLMAGKVSQQDAVMSSLLNTTLYRSGCHGFTDWNGTAKKWYSLEFVIYQIPNPHLALFLILQQFRWGESWKLAKGENADAAILFPKQRALPPLTAFLIHPSP